MKPDSSEVFRGDVKCWRGWCSMREPERPYGPKTLWKRDDTAMLHL